jgi:hypothetical protein
MHTPQRSAKGFLTSITRSALVVLSLAPALSFAAPAIFYTDLAKGPNSGGENGGGAYVTIFGAGFGASQGQVTVGGGAAHGYKQWTDKKIVVQLGASSTSGNIVVRDAAGETSNGLPFTVQAGRVQFATTSNFASMVRSVQAGDVVYLRAGNYSGRYGTTTWGNRSVVLGSWASNVAYVAYPGEAVTIGNFNFTDGNGMANNATVANMTIRGSWDAISGGHYWETEESGATGVRIVNNDCSGNYGSDNTMNGIINLGGDGWKVLGNHIVNDAPSAINNNHAIYVQVGADDVEIAWNKIDHMRMGHVIQFHNDGTARLYERNTVHDNEIVATNPMDIRGLNVGNVAAASTFTFYNNLLINLGQNVSAIAVTRGNVTVEGNTIAQCNVSSGAIQVAWDTQGRITARNNIVTGCPAFGATNGASMSQVTATATQTSASFDAAWRPTNPQTGVAPTQLVDHLGQRRSSPATIGAFQVGGTPVAVPNPPSGLSAQ